MAEGTPVTRNRNSTQTCLSKERKVWAHQPNPAKELWAQLVWSSREVKSSRLRPSFFQFCFALGWLYSRLGLLHVMSPGNSRQCPYCVSPLERNAFFFFFSPRVSQKFWLELHYLDLGQISWMLDCHGQGHTVLWWGDIKSHAHS